MASVGAGHVVSLPATRGVTRGSSLGSTIAIGAAGAVACALTVWVVSESPTLVNARAMAVVRGLLVAVWVCVGVLTFRRRSGSRLGPLFIAAGFLYAMVSLDASGTPLIYTAGRVLLAALVVYLIYLFTCFPRDRLTSRADRRFMLAYGLASAGVWALTLLLAYKLPAGGPLSDCASHCPNNPLAVVGSSRASLHVASALVNGLTMIGVAWVTGLLIRRARSTSSLRRRAVAPVLAAFLLIALSYLFYSVLNQHQSLAGKDVLRVINVTSALVVPIAFLLGQIRGRAFAMAKVGRLVAMAGRDPVDALGVEVMLRDALGDPSAQLAFVAPGRGGFVDVHGADLELPGDPTQRSVIPIARDGRPFAALIHQPDAIDDTDLVEGLAATSLTLLEHDRLLDELRASRARLAAAADSERLRIERDLHDGAQQQLIALEVRLSLLLDGVDEPELEVGLRRAVRDAQTARDQLRSLAHGVYPHVLDLGLGPALKTAAREASIPVGVDDRKVGRCEPEVEAAVYFCCLEAVQNATKHAGPDAHVKITLERRAREIVFSVTDDGAGFDGETTSGIGLLSMQDRIEAIGGKLSITSSRERGTSIRGIAPVLGTS